MTRSTAETSNALAQAAVAAATSSIWRVVHQAGARHELNEGQIAELRTWAGARMREHSYAAFDAGKRPTVMRATFADAIEHAARDISQGKSPG